jgi:hypothetical protein
LLEVVRSEVPDLKTLRLALIVPEFSQIFEFVSIIYDGKSTLQCNVIKAFLSGFRLAKQLIILVDECLKNDECHDDLLSELETAIGFSPKPLDVIYESRFKLLDNCGCFINRIDAPVNRSTRKPVEQPDFVWTAKQCEQFSFFKERQQ